MKKVKKIVCHIGEKTAYSSVGRSILMFGHETKIPDGVKKWVKVNRVT